MLVLLIVLTLWILFMLFVLYMHHVTITGSALFDISRIDNGLQHWEKPFFVRFWNDKKSNVRFKYKDWLFSLASFPKRQHSFHWLKECQAQVQHTVQREALGINLLWMVTELNEYVHFYYMIVLYNSFKSY